MKIQMTVGKRIGIGFAVVIAITLAIGGLGIYQMRITTAESNKLADEYVPEVQVATGLRSTADGVMYEMRGYELSEKPLYLQAAQEGMNEVNKHLQDAEELAQTALHLKTLKTEVKEVTEAVNNYDAFMKQTEQKIAAMNQQRSKLDANAQSYMTGCASFLDGQNKAFRKDLDERQRKVALVTQIVNLGTRVRVTNFKAQATNDMSLMQQAVDALGGLAALTEDLRPITRDAEDIRRIDATDAAAQSYAENMRAYVEASDALARAEQAMDAGASAYITHCRSSLDEQNRTLQAATGQDGADQSEQIRRISLIHDVINAGNAVRVTNFKGQAKRDGDLIRKAREDLNAVDAILADLRKITHRAGSIENLDKIEQAARTYGSAIDAYLTSFVKLDEIRKGMDAAAGQYVQQCAEFLAAQQKKLATDMRERHDKITLANDIINLGNDARVKAFKAQALRSREHMQAALANFPKLDAKYDDLRKITRLDADLALIDRTKAAGDAYAAALNSFLAEWNELDELGDKREKAGLRVADACKATADAGLRNTDEIAKGAAETLASGSSIMTVGLVLGAIVAIFAALWITRSITGPLTRIISGLNDGADQVNDAAAQVSSASQQLAEGASEQASSLEETSSALEEMAAMTRTNAENAKQANDLSGETRDAAQTGDQTMARLNAAMAEINESSGQISKIIKVIEEIAFQTNLLALNAAVEAARAGEHGKGFAVVADEVRNLAQRAAQAAKETTGLIENSVNKAKEGGDVAEQVTQALSGIVGNVAKVSDLIGGISQASEEQAQGVDQVNTAVSQMDKVTQQNASNAEESASASEELAAQAANVKGVVSELVTLVRGTNGRLDAANSVAKTTARKRLRKNFKAGPATKPQPQHAAAPSGGGGDEQFMSMDSDGDLSEF